MIPHLREKIRLIKRHYFPEVVALLVIFGAVGAFASLYAGQRSSLPIPYQGKLLDSNSIPVADGTYYMAFGIYNAASGGTCLWRTEAPGGGGIGCTGTSSSTAVTVSRGVFTVYLGSDAPANNPEITSSITNNFNSGTYWLGITSCGTNNNCDSEMTPRRQLGGVPYAYNADFLDGKDSTELILLSPGSSAQTLTFTGTTQDALTISATSTTSGTALTLTGPSGASAGVTDAILKITSDAGNLGGNGPGGLVAINTILDSTDSTSTAASLYISTTHASSSGSTGNTAYGIYNTFANTFAWPSTDYGMYSTVSNSGAATSTKTVYGGYFEATTAGALSSTTVYGLYVTGRAGKGGFDTSEAKYYGIYIANDSSGSQRDPGISNSTKYGLYVVEPRGADNNYAAIFEGAVGIGTTTPASSYLLTVASTTNADFDLVNIANHSTGTSALSGLRIANASSTLRIAVVGSQRTTSNQLVLNAGIIESGTDLSGGLNFSIANSSAPFRFYLNNGNHQALHIKPNSGGSGPLIGIGTSTPSYLLTLDNTGNNPTNVQLGQYTFLSNLQSGVEGVWIGYNAYASERTLLSATYPTDTSGAAGIYIGPGTAGIDFLVKNTNVGGGTFYSSSTLTNVKMRLDQYGNLGLGTTTPWIANDATGSTSTILTIGSQASKRGVLTLAAYTSGIVSIQAANSTTNWLFTLPANAGTSGQYLQTDGSGNTSWQTVSAGSGALSFVRHESGTAISGRLDTTTTLTSLTLPTLTNEDSLIIYYTYESKMGGQGMQVALEIADTPDKKVACLVSLGGQGSCNNMAGGDIISGNIVLRKSQSGAILGVNAGAATAGGSLSGGTVSSTWSNASWTAGTATLKLTIASSTNTTDVTSTWRMSIYKLVGQ